MLPVFFQNIHSLTRLMEICTVDSWVKLSQNDRYAFIICLVTLRYPILYDMVCLRTQFKIQTSVNRHY